MSVIELVGVDIGGPCKVAGQMKVKSGIGASGSVAFGWEDTEGYRMVGLGGEVAAAVHLGFSLFAGTNEQRAVKLSIEAANFGIVARVELSSAAELSSADAAESEPGPPQAVHHLSSNVEDGRVGSDRVARNSTGASGRTTQAASWFWGGGASTTVGDAASDTSLTESTSSH